MFNKILNNLTFLIASRVITLFTTGDNGRIESQYSRYLLLALQMNNTGFVSVSFHQNKLVLTKEILDQIISEVDAGPLRS